MKRLLIIAAVALLAGCAERVPQGTMTPAERTLAVYQDGETGCQYLKPQMMEAALTPRLGRDGKPLCGAVR